MKKLRGFSRADRRLGYAAFVAVAFLGLEIPFIGVDPGAAYHAVAKPLSYFGHRIFLPRFIRISARPYKQLYTPVSKYPQVDMYSRMSVVEPVSPFIITADKTEPLELDYLVLFDSARLYLALDLRSIRHHNTCRFRG